MLAITVYLLVNMFRVYLTYRFVKVFLGKTEKSKYEQFFAYGLFYGCNTVFFLLMQIAWVNVITNLIGCFLAVMYLYRNSVKQNVFVTVAVYIISMLCDVISTVPFVKYQDGKMMSSVFAIVSTLLILFSELLVEKIMEIRNKEYIQLNLALIVVPLCSILMICYMTYSGTTLAKDVVVISIGLLGINFFVVYLYNLLLTMASDKYEKEMLNQKVKVYAQQLETIRSTEQNMRALKHDMKHHFNELKLLAIHNENVQIQEYIDEMGAFLENPKELVSSGNTEIDSVLNYMLLQAKEQSIDVKVNVKIPENIKHFFDVNIILGNLLENAIEAAVKTEEKILHVNIQFSKGVLKIEVENSYKHRLKKKDEDFQTTKSQKERHGIGLKNVKKIVEKYNGIIEIDTAKTFKVKLMLYMEGR